ncbi:MAG: hypothetical protein WC661_16830 [Opitutaceae bacterium]|jgi:uncharacterized membrane protein
MTPSAAVALAPVFRKATLRTTTVLLVSAALLPLLVHLLPSWDALPVGAHLLPMFWTTFVAAYFFGARVGALTGLIAPLVNLLLTALPAWKMIALLGSELVIFAIAAAWLVKRAPRCWLLAALSAIAAFIFGAGLQTAMLPHDLSGTPAGLFVATLTTGLPGLVLLTVINLILVKRFPKS